MQFEKFYNRINEISDDNESNTNPFGVAIKEVSTEENDAKRVCDKLEKMRARKNGLSRVQKNTLLTLTTYYKSLNEDYYVQELLPDESYEHWFD